MSFFNWFKRTTAPALRQPRSVSARTHTEATTQRSPVVTTEVAQQHRTERMKQRELLYSVVRDAMVRASVLSASYKFKVLALDQRGLQFLVMMDLAREYGGETVRLSDIEGLIAQTAKTRHGITVAAVYWRIDDHIATTAAQRGVAPQAAGQQSLPPTLPQRQSPVDTQVSPPSPARSSALERTEVRSSSNARPGAGLVKPLVTPRFDPIGAEEVAAFKRALASAAAMRPTTGTAAQSVSRRPAPSDSQFPDTEMPDDCAPRARSSSLSHTQYGDL